MNLLFIVIMIVGVGALLWMVKSKQASLVLAGALLVIVLAVAAINLKTAVQRPPEPEDVVKKNLVIEALGWKAGKLINQISDGQQEILVLHPSVAAPSPTFRAPHEIMKAALLMAMDPEHPLVEHAIQLPPMALEGFAADELAKALEAHPSTDVVLSLMGPPRNADKMREVLPEGMPCIAVCFGDSPQLREMAHSGLLIALAPREEATGREDSPEAIYENVFRTYCSLLRKEQP